MRNKPQHRFDNIPKPKHLVSIGIGKLLFFFKFFPRKTLAVSITTMSIQKGKERTYESRALYRVVDKKSLKNNPEETENQSQLSFIPLKEQSAQRNEGLQRDEINRNDFYKKCFEFYKDLFRK